MFAVVTILLVALAGTVGGEVSSVDAGSGVDEALAVATAPRPMPVAAAPSIVDRSRSAELIVDPTTARATSMPNSFDELVEPFEPVTTTEPTTTLPPTTAPPTTARPTTTAAETTTGSDTTTETTDAAGDGSSTSEPAADDGSTTTVPGTETTVPVETTVAPATTTTAPEAWVDAGHGVLVPPVLLEIRRCESTNNYTAANPNSSARGAYQFLTGSWDAYGHKARYGVNQAHLATPAQQDEAALITWQRDGTRPWNASKSCWS